MIDAEFIIYSINIVTDWKANNKEKNMGKHIIGQEETIRLIIFYKLKENIEVAYKFRTICVRYQDFAKSVLFWNMNAYSMTL